MQRTEPPLGVIFDVGGTLVWSTDEHFETAGAWAVANELRADGRLHATDSFANALVALRRWLPSDGRRHEQINTLPEALVTVLRAFQVDGDEDEVRRLEGVFVAPALVGMRGIPGAVEAARALHGRVRLGVMSNTRSHAFIAGLVEAIGLGGVFDPIVTSAAVGMRKPSPEAFAPVVEAWGLEPARLVMIGNDLKKDVMGAKRAGMRAVWWRASPAEARGWDVQPAAFEPEAAELEPTIAMLDPEAKPPEPDGVADSGREILQILRGWGVDLPASA